MKIIEPSFVYLSKEIYTPIQFIEKIGRTCYKSEDKITDDSASKFIDNLVKHGHLAMLEHYWIHIKIADYKSIIIGSISEYFGKRDYNPLKYMEIDEFEIEGVTYSIISAPLRVFIEMDKYDFIDADLSLKAIMYSMKEWGNSLFSEKEVYNKSLEEMVNIEFVDENFIFKNIYDWNFPKKKHITHTYCITCDRGISHELVRHRPCNFAQESTRYANYSKEKFGNEITVIRPFFFREKGNDIEKAQYNAWYESCYRAEEMYIYLVTELKAKPEEARSVLPNSLKTEIIITANELEWQHIINLRVRQITGKSHPQMFEVMYPIYEDLKNRSNGRII